MTTELRWSAAWADVVGADGPVITDLLGRRIPCLTEQQRDELRVAWRDRYPVDSRVRPGVLEVWKVADTHGLRAVLACAHQSAGRALRTHITGPVASDDWSLWTDLEDPLHALMGVLVLRRVAPTVGVLAGPWESVMGALPAVDDLAEARGGPQPCTECGRPHGARLVTEAEAARYARNLLAGSEFSVRSAGEREDRMRQTMREWRRDYRHVGNVTGEIQAVLDWPGKIPPKLREWLARQLGYRLGVTLRADGAGVPADALFDLPDAS